MREPDEDNLSGVDRRSLLTGFTVAAASAAAIVAKDAAAQTAAPKKPAILKGLPDVAVIGAGAFGGWTALVLRERGYKVTLIDAYGPGNPHASSGGESRNIRAGYGDHEIYSDWASKAWVLWRQREEEFRRTLLYPSGSLRDPGPKLMAAQIAVFDKLKLPYEMLTPEEVAKRWPQIRTDDIPKVFYDTNSGIVKARETSIAVAEVFEQKGGQSMLGKATVGRGGGGKLNTVLVDGQPLAAGQFVFALGPWFSKMFPDFMKDMVRPQREEQFYIGPAPGDNRYHWENCPGISDQYTYTSSDIGGGYKVGARMPPTPIDPDDADRLPTYYLFEKIEKYLKLRLPGLVGRPVIQTHVCQTEETTTGNYIIDRHPEYANALIAGGGSGHAFKMGPFLGPYIADRIAGKPWDPEEQKLFSLAAHSAANSSHADMTTS